MSAADPPDPMFHIHVPSDTPNIHPACFCDAKPMSGMSFCESTTNREPESAVVRTQHCNVKSEPGVNTDVSIAGRAGD